MTLRIVSDDGIVQVVEERDDKGVLLVQRREESPSSDIAKQEAAEQAAVERHRDVLRQQLDPKRPDPSVKEIADAQAFIALANDIGITEALAVADETILAEPVDQTPVDPKG